MRVLLLAILMFSSQLAFTQTDTTAPSSSDLKNEYLQKSRNQQGWAWGLLIGGSILSGVGLAIAASEVFEDGSDESPVATAFYLVGTASMLGSIPLFIAGRKNKRLAESAGVSFDLEKWQGPRLSSAQQRNFPAIKIRIPIR